MSWNQINYRVSAIDNTTGELFVDYVSSEEQAKDWLNVHLRHREYFDKIKPNPKDWQVKIVQVKS